MCKIIIVDDEKLLRQGFLHMTDWAAHGFQVIGEAANGSEALQLIADTHPDIVVTDIRMPVMNGIELTRIIKEKFPAIQVIILSSYNDFDYVRETLTLGALDYVLKPKMEYKELLNLLQKAKQKISLFNTESPKKLEPSREQSDNLRQLFLKNLVSNKHLDQIDTIRENLQLYALDLKETGMFILYLIFDRNIGTLEYQQIETVLQTALGTSAKPCSFLYNDQSYGVILNDIPNEPSGRDGLCRQLLEHVQRNYGLGLWIIISDPFDGFQNIQPNFHRLFQLSQFCFYFNCNRMLRNSDIPHCLSIVDFDTKALDNAIEKLDFTGLYEQMKTVPEEKIASGTYIDPYVLKKFFIEGCFNLIRKLNELRLGSEAIAQKKFSYFKNLEVARSYSELLQILQEILGEIEQNLFIAKESSSPIIRRIIGYIMQNYTSEISLNSVAQIFHLNKSYLCELFKQQTGENFNDFLVTVRIEKAKQLLRDPEHNIGTVCNLVGYSNPSYFGQVFKNIVGLTPSEYSKQYMTH